MNNLEKHKEDFAKVWMRLDDFQRKVITDSIHRSIVDVLGRVNGQINFKTDPGTEEENHYNLGITSTKEVLQEEINRHQ